MLSRISFRPGATELEPAFVLESRSDTRLAQRRITAASLSTAFDVAVFQVENGVEATKRATRSGESGSTIVDRRHLVLEMISSRMLSRRIHVADFADATSPPILSADVYAGKFLADVPANARPFIPGSPHFETSLAVGSGASGCPVFHRGAIVGLSSRSWSFDPDATSDSSFAWSCRSASFSPSSRVRSSANCMLGGQAGFHRIAEGKILTFGRTSCLWSH